MKGINLEFNNLDYASHVEVIAERLSTAHNPEIAKIRGEFFDKEFEFLRGKLKDQEILVAGCGLGHDSIELAKQNKRVVGIDLFKDFIDIAKVEAKKLGVQNLEFKMVKSI